MAQRHVARRRGQADESPTSIALEDRSVQQQGAEDAAAGGEGDALAACSRQRRAVGAGRLAGVHRLKKPEVKQATGAHSFETAADARAPGVVPSRAQGEQRVHDAALHERLAAECHTRRFVKHQSAKRARLLGQRSDV